MSTMTGYNARQASLVMVFLMAAGCSGPKVSRPATGPVPETRPRAPAPKTDPALARLAAMVAEPELSISDIWGIKLTIRAAGTADAALLEAMRKRLKSIYFPFVVRAKGDVITVELPGRMAATWLDKMRASLTLSGRLEMMLVDDGSSYLEQASLNVKPASRVKVGRDSYSPKPGVEPMPYTFLAFEDLASMARFFSRLPPRLRAPRGRLLLWGYSNVSKHYPSLLETYLVEKRSFISNADIEAARLMFDTRTGMPNVQVVLTDGAVKRMARVSGANIGRRLAIVVDDDVIVAPVITGAIKQKKVRIDMGKGTSLKKMTRECMEVADWISLARPLPVRLEQVKLERMNPKRVAELLARPCATGVGPKEIPVPVATWACMDMGALYLQGKGVPQDKPRAVGFVRKACAADPPAPFACALLGRLTYNGDGVSKDLTAAKKHFERSCKARVGMGCHLLGEMFFKGEGVPADKKRALELYRKACDESLHPSKRACFTLGGLHERGELVTANREEARAYFDKACSMGHKQACKQIK